MSPSPGSGAAAPAPWPPRLTIAPIVHAQGEVRLPGSKSISNRALLLAALAQGTTRLRGLLEADDTQVMIEALRSLGVVLRAEGEETLVQGCGGQLPVRAAELHLGNAGTAMRPLTAVLAFAAGHYRLDGVARMRERPIGDLVDALRAAGARISYLGKPGYPPLAIEPPESAEVRHVAVRGDVSSQFLSGLLLAAPGRAGPSGLRIEVHGPLISKPYVDLTVAMMRRFGADVQADAGSYWVRPGGYLAPGRYVIEGDASGASYFLALGAVAGGPVRVVGVGRGSLQGDLGFTEVLAAMGAQVSMGEDWIQAEAPATGSGHRRLRAIEFDATRIPDAAMTAAVLALFAPGESVLRGIGSWRVKETDRIAAMATELRRLGAAVEAGLDWLRVRSPEALREAEVQTYDDHRMAMCLALAAAGGVPVHVLDPACVAKTYPGYFDELRRLCAPRRDPGATKGPLG